MIEPAPLHLAIRRQVHPGLTIDVEVTVQAELGILFGRSGAGKTSILRLIAGLDTPDAGSIRVGETVLFDRDGRINRRLRDRRVGYVFQHDVLFPHLDVEHNVRYGLHGWPRREATERAREVAELCGISHLLNRTIMTLSGGERQRVGLARAIAPRPRVLLCDEPVSALDLDARYRLLARLREVQRVEAIPILLVTHAVDEALTFGDRLWLLEAGRVEAEGKPDAILADLASRHYLTVTRLQNVFGGVVLSHDLAGRATSVRLTGGPDLIVSAIERPVGAPVVVRIDSEEIVLALGELGPLSARNRISGTISRVLIHETAAEVAVQVGDLTWMVGVLAATVRSLDLKVGDPVQLIVKARSCRTLLDDQPD